MSHRRFKLLSGNYSQQLKPFVELPNTQECLWNRFQQFQSNFQGCICHLMAIYSIYKMSFLTAIIQAIQHIFHKIFPNFELPCLNDFSGSWLFLPSALACCFRNSFLGHSHMLRLLQRRKAFFPVRLLQRLKQGPSIFIWLRLFLKNLNKFKQHENIAMNYDKGWQAGKVKNNE